MSDIIQTAQDLRSELESERKDWIRERGGEYIEMPLDCTVMYGDEDAREVIGALAEETWEYAVQIERSDGWEYTRKPWESRWLQNYDAQLKHVQRGFPGEKTRIMRRRVSPPEVCE